MADTDDAALVGEAAHRASEILNTKGDTTSARALLQRAAASGDATFAPQATGRVPLCDVADQGWGVRRGAKSDPGDAVVIAEYLRLRHHKLKLTQARPVTKASGHMHNVAYRWACNKRFRQAVATFADNSRHESPGGTDRPPDGSRPSTQGVDPSTPGKSVRGLRPGW